MAALRIVTLKYLGDVDDPKYLDGRTGDNTVGLVPSTDGFSRTRWVDSPPPPPVPEIPPSPPGTPDPSYVPRTIPVPAPDPHELPGERRRRDPGNPINPRPAPP